MKTQLILECLLVSRGLSRKIIKYNLKKNIISKKQKQKEHSYQKLNQLLKKNLRKRRKK